MAGPTSCHPACRPSGSSSPARPRTTTGSTGGRAGAARSGLSATAERGPRVGLARPDGDPCCPYYVDGCTVREARPAACRQFGCFRRDPTDPFRGLEGMLARLAAAAGIAPGEEGSPDGAESDG